MKRCGICGEPLTAGAVVHMQCLEEAKGNIKVIYTTGYKEGYIDGENDGHDQAWNAGYRCGWMGAENNRKSEEDGRWISEELEPAPYGVNFWVCDKDGNRSIAHKSNDGVSDYWVPVLFWDGRTGLRGPVTEYRELVFPERPIKKE